MNPPLRTIGDRGFGGGGEAAWNLSAGAGGRPPKLR
jgi:hypothetical protein